MSILLALPLLAAAPFADLAGIDAEVAAFTGAPIGQPGGAAAPVDRRLRLVPCPARLALTWYGSAHQTVLVQCPLPGGWRLFVPLAAPVAAASAAPLVMRGEAVTIQVSGQGFAVSRVGEALESGGEGAWIRVRPAGAKASEALRGRVLHPGVVGIELP